MSDQLHHLIKMINQISTNLDHGDKHKAAEAVAAHIKKFWARSMKQQIIEYEDIDGSELNQVSRLAVAQLKELRQAS
ncbi:hypothetical protein RE428_05670 [Marinobacter nanhaiticus D15-8W]|uniref:Formate dehydrogenase n=1 Tax=Marinobacter nanhaiticus D15-8W TaxID=626887 RepID=N6X126_9GAMM|nr:formate dehydrogenase subunit delta [Marinobacter nanhaiticus]ENO14763.1 formate dehydrogenase [Marinobacter nanhaiticus D15-8W]BES69549.1 hypothetical protein RE428_05670 [Marinobacter nanhaiticus D15-8W]